VLVIIGLLLGGVLKGQELINSAKVKNLATDFKNISVFIYGYQDKFRALPGDDAGAASHVGATTGYIGDGNGLIAGSATAHVGWDGYKAGALDATSEAQLFWLDVRLANLAAGSTATGTDLLPQNAMGGVVGVVSGDSTNNPDSGIYGTPASAISGTYVACSSNILGKYATQLDIQMDDGIYSSGSVRVYSQTVRGAALTAVATTALDPAGTYVVCMGI